MFQRLSLSIYLCITISLNLSVIQSAESSERFNHSEYFFTYLGGINNESAFSLALDSNNNIYITGQTNSDAFDNLPLVENTAPGSQNCFILKISSETSQQDYLHIFGGSKRETCRRIAVDQQNNVYLTGETQSDDLPVTTNRDFSGEWDSFLLKLNNKGELIYASYIGGKLTDYGHGLAVQAVDQVFLAGETWSTDFPTTNNAFMPNCQAYSNCDGSKANAFIIHVDTSVSNQFVSQFSTYLGGSSQDKAHDIAVDVNGHLHVVGETRSPDFPLHNQLQDSLNGTFDGFLAIINPNNTKTETLLMSTYLGGSNDDYIFAVSTSTDGDSIVTGETHSNDFPTTLNAFSTACSNGSLPCNSVSNKNSHADAFVSVIHHTPFPILNYSSYIGGSKDDIALDVLINQQNIFIAGLTWSADFPITNNARSPACNRGGKCSNSDGFLLKLDLENIQTDALVYSTYVGGADNDSVTTLGAMNDSILFVSGETYSNNNASVDAIDLINQNGDVFLQKLTINDDGFWTNKPKTHSPQPKPSAVTAAYLNLYFLITLFGFYTSSKILRINLRIHCI